MDMITLAMANAYADRFVTTTRKVLVPKAVTSNMMCVFYTPLNVAAGDTLTVNVDGVEYNCVAFSEGGTVLFGSRVADMAPGRDAEYPFAYLTYDGKGLFYTKEKTATFSVIKHTETIDQKYLPDVRLSFVIDLPISESILFSEADIPVDDDIAAQLSMAAENYIPVDIRVELTNSESLGIYRVYHFNLFQIVSASDGKIFWFQAYVEAKRYLVAYSPEGKIIKVQEVS